MGILWRCKTEIFSPSFLAKELQLNQVEWTSIFKSYRGFLISLWSFKFLFLQKSPTHTLFFLSPHNYMVLCVKSKCLFIFKKEIRSLNYSSPLINLFIALLRNVCVGHLSAHLPAREMALISQRMHVLWNTSTYKQNDDCLLHKVR